ncbi:hypothetical protein [Actinomadura sp. 9N215]|uniref:hypothetical protein n=1 Tax=Actinomadura sp. 9N215 TaxID=3375150 RepID=UPI0037A3C372
MSRKTDLLAVMSAVRPEQLDPPDDPGRLERFRAAALSGTESPPPGRRRRLGVRHGVRHGGGRRRGVRYAVAGAMAGVLVISLIIVTRPGDRQPSARQTLLAAATTLGRGVSATGRYWTADLSSYITVAYVGDTPTGPPPPTAKPLYRYSSTCDARLWAASSSRDGSWLVIDSVTDRRLSRADERAWREDGSPGPRGCQIHNTSIGLRSAPPAALRLVRTGHANSPDEPTYPNIAGIPVTLDQIAALPTHPAALKAALDDLWLDFTAPRGGGARRDVPPDVTVREIADLLVSVPTPPASQAALYRVLADLPIKRSRGTVTDRLGRRGVAFWSGVGAMADKLIVDPRTGHPLALERYVAGELDAYTLVRRQGGTDVPPVLPAKRL